MLAEMQEFFLLPFEQPRHRNAGPPRHHRGDVVLIHLFLEQAGLPLLALEPRFFGRQLTLELGQLAIFEFGYAVEVVLPLGLLHGDLGFLALFFQPAQLADGGLLHLPARLELRGLGFQVRQLFLQPLQAHAGGLIRLFAQGFPLDLKLQHSA